MNRKGFTLIELLIVLTVIGILVAIVIPSFRGMQQEGNLTKAEQELNTLQAAVESYYRHNGHSYPPDGAGTTPMAYQDSLINQKYFRIISQYLKDPFNNNKLYSYTILKDVNGIDYYVVWSNGINNVKDWQWLNEEGKIKISADKDDIIRTNALIGN
ncbi:MAG: hypothetical protein DKM50_07365 [Candidatus Margulisiibacteriota bacterium]|nr:MAG: hypothetical protein A2X43_12695 [Candidatus Margulisbacteria bacterium GWD2_39_127]OGI02089.1 MAG: hypothetical protein A2X42_01310 [Candidatus Margulisbacteria bacterium GWF2_38_17]OGI10466.1 MAG: hypothetical protein A2X41_06810 [Candidatus Margulisbacteria bacterium GWE2_39_32]PZM79988.1 MAG: hypothetical protein DKM50_07365 [Candidatus Margulisiibacteriota bacterium]HAR62455.1 hypothetical protein [Candidatus Margulisiibacteriota bacterium]